MRKLFEIRNESLKNLLISEHVSNISFHSITLLGLRIRFLFLKLNIEFNRIDRENKFEQNFQKLNKKKVLKKKKNSYEESFKEFFLIGS
jgi:hypothetical protein